MTTPDTLAACQQYCEDLKAQLRIAADLLRRGARNFADLDDTWTEEAWRFALKHGESR
jgi:hypothetical protein